MPIAYNVNTGAIYTKNGKICTNCCGFIPLYSSGNCCCYLDPSPPDWNSGAGYSLYDCVTYSGQTWYSTQANNVNHTPISGSSWWARYTACGNEEWNSVSPFGGIGKSPLYYGVSVYYRYYRTRPDLSIWVDYVWKFYMTLQHSGGCNYQKCADTTVDRYYYYAGSGTTIADRLVLTLNTWLQLAAWNGSIGNFLLIDDSCTPNKQSVTNSGFLVFKSTSIGSECYDLDNPANGILIPVCQIKGVIAKQCDVPFYTNMDHYVFNVSWRPLDCNYALWDSTVNYNVDDCVSWDGWYFKACRRSGPSYDGAQEPSSSDPTTCTGSNYWRRLT